MSTYYRPAERAAGVRDLFAAIASRYDLINDLQSFGLHRYWKRQVRRLSEVGAGERALDLCCGTGDLVLGMAETGAEVVGVDFSGPMLQVARGRLTGNRGVRVMQGDALLLPFYDGQFDVVTIAYGLRNLQDFRAGLREMWRVLKPGGRLLVLDFGKPRQPMWRRVYFGYLRRGVPVLGRLFAGNAEAYAYILESLQAYPGQEGVAGLMSELGFERVQIRNFLGGVMSINMGRKRGGKQ